MESAAAMREWHPSTGCMLQKTERGRAPLGVLWLCALALSAVSSVLVCVIQLMRRYIDFRLTFPVPRMDLERG